MSTITIFAPRATLDAWDAWLRDPNNKQASCFLERRDSETDEVEGHCCLGGLQMALDGKVEKSYFGSSLHVPTIEWLGKNGITFLEEVSDVVWPEGAPIPYLPSLGTNATAANDSGEYSFIQIADAIKLCSKATDEPDYGPTPQ
jgi:hypothetical protein